MHELTQTYNYRKGGSYSEVLSNFNILNQELRKGLLLHVLTESVIACMLTLSDCTCIVHVVI